MVVMDWARGGGGTRQDRMDRVESLLISVKHVLLADICLCVCIEEMELGWLE